MSGSARGAHSRADRRAWTVVGAAYLAGVTAAAGQYKLPPSLPTVMADLGADLTAASTLVTVFGLAGVAFALPAGWLLARIGARRAGALAMMLIAMGDIIAVIGASYPALVVDQALEGAGLVLIAVVAPSVIAGAFPAERVGVPMGVWATWAPVGGLLMFTLAPWLGGTGGWQAAWWLGAATAIAAGVIFVVTVGTDEPLSTAPSAGRAAPTAAHGDRGRFANRDLWWLALSFGCYCLATNALTALYPTFLVTERGMDLMTASMVTSLSMVAFLVVGPLSGVVSDRLGSRRLVYSVPVLLTVPLWPIVFLVAGWQVVLLMLLMGMLWAASPTAVFATVPEVVGSRAAVGIGMAALMLGQNLGYAVGPVAFASLVEGAGWSIAGWAMVPVTIAGVMAGWRVRVR